MANLTVRKIDDEVYRRLQARAAAHGVSMEEEVRRILRKAVAAPKGLGQWAMDCFGPVAGVDLALPSREPPHEPPELERNPEEGAPWEEVRKRIWPD